MAWKDANQFRVQVKRVFVPKACVRQAQTVPLEGNQPHDYHAGPAPVAVADEQPGKGKRVPVTHRHLYLDLIPGLAGLPGDKLRVVYTFSRGSGESWSISFWHTPKAAGNSQLAPEPSWKRWGGYKTEPELLRWLGGLLGKQRAEDALNQLHGTEPE